MMLGWFSVLVLILFIVRALSRLLDGVHRRRAGEPARRRGAAARRRTWSRDPVCGTFVVPGSALTCGHGRQRVYFCSETCRA